MEKSNDLTARLPVFGNDEIGQQAKSVNAFIEKLQSLIKDITDAFGVLTTATTQMSEIIATSQEYAKNQAVETTSVASAVNELASTVDEVAQSAESASSNAQSANTQAKSDHKVIGETVEYVNLLDDDLTSSAQVIEGLNKSSYEIASMVDVIKSIAEQTNLLALNAAIEAARAGEQGRGFAVVADEVRTLAQRTQDSTKEIEDSVALVREGADKAVASITSNKERAAQLVEKANSASNALREITAAVSSILEVNTMIATAAEEQSVVVNEVNASIQSIDESASEASRNSDNLAKSSVELAELSVKVKQQLEQFRV